MLKRLLLIGIAVLVGKALGIELDPIGSAMLFMGAVTMVSGDRSTTDMTTNRIKVDMGKVSLLNPNKTPFIALMTRLNKRVAINPKYMWIERNLLPRWDAANGEITAAATELVVDNGGYFIGGDLIEIPSTQEVIYVTSVSTNTLTIVRGVGGTTAAVIPDNDAIQIIGNASEEGATKRTLKTTKGAEVYNYTQIFRLPYGVTETEKNSEMYGGKDINMIRKEMGITHAIDMERAALFGERDLVTSGTHPKRYSRGLLRSIELAGSSSRVVDAGGTLTQPEFESWLRVVIANDPEAKRVIFCSRLVASIISQFAYGKLQTVSGDKTTFGINVTRYISPMGIFNLIQQPLLTGAVYGGYAVAVALKECKYRPLQNRDTKLKMAIQANDADAAEEEYLTEAGFQFEHADKHSILYGVTD